MNSIIKTFSERGTFVQPDTLNYILSKENPTEFTSFITKNLKEYPLVLTVDQVKEIEQVTQVKDPPKLTTDSQEMKQLQSKMLSSIFSGELKPEISDELDLDYDDPDKDDQIKISEEEQEEIIPKPIDIKKVKGWKPLAKEYEPEINIIRDVTGNSTCEGTTNDFTKLFVNRFNALRKILRNQRRELANAIPIKRIKKSGVKDIQIVGIVKDVRTTTNGHRLIELEDDTDIATCIALKNNRDILQLAHEVVLDEIVGVGDGRIFFGKTFLIIS